MRKIYLVKKNPELPVNGNNWIVMNGFEFMKFIQTPEGRERRKCFGQLDACSVDDVIIIAECGIETAKKWRSEKDSHSYLSAKGMFIMELSEKLQELRKEKGLTQEELAEALFVSRTAISKWESGRGVPNIESLKAISKFFSVSIDELLSGEEILKIADEDNKQKEKHTRDLVFGLLDCSLIMFLFLPFFGQKGDEIIKEVSLLSLTGTPQYIKIPYLIIVFGIVLTGVLLLALQNYEAVFWLKHKHQISIVLSTVATIEFMITLQPYAAFFTFVFLAIKSLMLIKWR